MPHQTDVFPFFELDDAEETLAATPEHALAVRQRVVDLLDEYGESGGDEIEHMLQEDGAVDTWYALAFGLTHDTWAMWESRGFAPRSVLSDMLLKIALSWCGVIARRAFIAGVAYQKRAAKLGSLWATLEGAGIECLEAKGDDGNDMG